MSKVRSRRDSNLRRHIAYIAARLMAEDGVPDYASAKLKAARQAGLADSHLLPDNADERRKAFAAIRQVLTASGELTGNAAARLSTIARLFGLEGDTEEKIIDLLKAS